MQAKTSVYVDRQTYDRLSSLRQDDESINCVVRRLLGMNPPLRTKVGWPKGLKRTKMRGKAIA